MSQCGRCNGSGKELRITHIPADGQPGAFDCRHCSGFGKTTLAGVGSPRGSRVCFVCNGQGRVREVGQEVECHTCHATGERPDYVRGMSIPQSHRCDHASKEFTEAWLRDSEVVILRRDGGHTWAEHNLGLGMGSVTDYGAAWNSRDEDLALSVVKDLIARPPQFIHIVSKDDAVVGNTVIVLLNRSGYSKLVQGSSTGLGGLPPTYTIDLLLSEAV